jgi:hypothetical protein
VYRGGLLEHLLEHHFDTVIARVETARDDVARVARTVLVCRALRKSDKSHPPAHGRFVAKLSNEERPT